MYNKSIRITYIAIGVYLLLYVLLPARRALYDWQAAENPLLSFLVDPGQYIVMFLITLFAIVNLIKPIPSLDRLLHPKVLVVATCIALPVCLTLFLLHIPGLWWTWSTVGLHFSSIVLIMLLLRDRLPTSVAFFFACGCSFVAIGVWEIVYKYGFWYFNDLPQNVVIRTFWGQFWFMVPFVAYGLFVIILHMLKHRRLAQVNIPFVACLALLAGSFAYWFVSGFWCDILYDWSTKSWYLNPVADNLSMSVYRSSKVFLNLSFASLVWIAPAITLWKRELCLQPGYCKKEEEE